MKLTNKDISEQYRGYEFWLMRSDFMGAFSYWVVVQSPYKTPDISNSLLAFSEFLDEYVFKKDLPMKFSYSDIQAVINEDIFDSIPAIKALNKPKIDTGAKIMYTSRFHKPKQDYDFIDLGALARNVFYMILREQITQGDIKKTA